jgi:D-alanyl-D-alanine carboxypeptidase (penicillin-binding protein 5/6)
MKKILVFVIIIMLMVGNAFGGDLIAKSYKTKKTKVKKEPIHTWVPYEAYAVADAETGIILEGLNINLPHPQASLTKIMLACVIVDKIDRGELNLTDLVKAPKKIEKIGGTSVFLKAGETFPLEDLMHAILVQSANDAAYAVAEYASGSISDFIVLMNSKAQDLGMTNTIFYSVNGLPSTKKDYDNITTCVDMVKLAQEALKSPKIREWVAIESTPFRKSIISNHNKLLGKTPEVDGIKTGFTRRAGFNIVATGKNDERRIIVIVLGSPMPIIRDNFAMEKFKEYLLKKEIYMYDVSRGYDKEVN